MAPLLNAVWLDYRATLGSYSGQVVAGSPLPIYESNMAKTVAMPGFGWQPVVNSVWQNFSVLKTKLENVRTSGRIPFTDIGWWDRTAPANNVKLNYDAIINGATTTISGRTIDNWLTQWAQDAAAYGHPFMVRQFHEMNLPPTEFSWGIGTSTWGGITYTNTVAGHIAAWRHIIDIFRKNGAWNVTFMWCPNIRGVATTAGGTGDPTRSYALMYPGFDTAHNRSYVDWLALDGYNWAGSANDPWLTFDQVFRGTGASPPITWLRNSYAELCALDTTLPVCFAETASSDNVGTSSAPVVDRNLRATWFTDAGTALTNVMPRVNMVRWFFTNYDTYHWTPDGDSTLSTSVDSAAFRGLVAPMIGGAPLPRTPADLTPLQPYAATPPGLSPSAPSGAQIQQNSVTVTYTSVTPTNTWAEYGPTTAYGTATAKTDTSPYVKSHSVTMIGLTAGTLYHCRVRGEDSWGNAAASADFSFTTTTPSADPYVTAEIAVTGRVAQFILNDTGKANGSTMADSVGAFSGTYSGNPVNVNPGIIPTSANDALRVDGSTWGTTASAAGLSPEVGAGTGKMSLSGWWQEPSAPAATWSIAAKGTTGNFEYALQRTTTGLAAAIWQNNGNNYVTTAATISASPNVRHRATMVYDDSLVGGLKLKLYFDGIQFSTGATGIGTVPTAGTAAFTIGERALGDQRAPNGVILEFVVLRNNALTAAQELSIYTAASTSPVASTISTTASADLAGAIITRGPLTAATPTVINTGITSVDLTWAASVGGQQPVTYVVQQAPDVAGSPGTFVTISAPLNAPTFTAVALQPSTKYWFREIVTDSTASPVSVTSSSVSATTATIGIVSTQTFPQTFPQIICEISLTDPTQAPRWQSITPYVKAFDSRRGRAFELDRIEAGTATVLLDNSDGRFNPYNASGPYFGSLKRMRRMRIRAAFGSGFYPIFSGFVEQWPQTMRGLSDDEAAVPLVDGFGTLALSTLSATYVEQKTDARIDRVLTDAMWTTGQAWILGDATYGVLGTTTTLGPVGDRRINPGQTTLPLAALTDTTALSHLQDVQIAEDGWLFAGADGVIVFYGRNRRTGQAGKSTLALFGDRPLDHTGELHYVDCTLTDDVPIYNELRVTRSNGTLEQLASDATSQGQYFPRTLNMSVLAMDDTVALAMAGYYLQRYKQPALRVSSLVLDGTANPSVLWPQILGREIADPITVRNRPPNAGLVEQPSWIEGIEHHWIAAGGDWSTTWHLSPISQAIVWILGSSALGINTVLGTL